MKQFIISILGLAFFLHASAQKIEIFLPHFAGKGYTLNLYQGMKKDTVAKGALDETGKVAIKLPESCKNYRGMGHLQFSENVALDLVIADENFQVSSLAEHLNLDNIIFHNSPENKFLIEQFKFFTRLKQQNQTLEAVAQLFDKQSEFYKAGLSEQIRVKDTIRSRDLLLQHSTLYASQMMKFQNYLDNMTNAFMYAQQSDKMEQYRNYGVDSLNLEALYNSGLWNLIIDYWIAMYRDFVKDNDDMLAKDVITILSRTKSDELFEEFASTVVQICTRNSWDNTVSHIADYLVRTGKDYRSFLLSQTVGTRRSRPGMPAIALESFDHSLVHPKNTLLIFYESGCSNCTVQLNKIKENYSKLQQQGIRVISIAADQDKNVYEYYSGNFPWKDKLCDYKGFEGINFRNYGILGTPTIYVIDEKGIIRGRYSSLDDTGIVKY